MELDKLEQLCTQRRLVHLERPEIDEGADVKGFLLDAGSEWILLNEVSDFHTNGFTLVRRQDVDAVRRGRYERTMEAILRMQQTRAQNPGFRIRLDLADEMFEDLLAAKLPLIVEGEDPDDEFFYIGNLVRVGKKSLSIHHFDATGRWDEMPSLLSYEGITRVTFGSEYINTFARYTR